MKDVKRLAWCKGTSGGLFPWLYAAAFISPGGSGGDVVLEGSAPLLCLLCS
jgi:hypothetical protein